MLAHEVTVEMPLWVIVAAAVAGVSLVVVALYLFSRRE